MRVIFLILISFRLVGQTKATNYTDANGLKQGFWIIKDSVLISHCDDCAHPDKYKLFLKAEGKYKDDKKTDRWVYYMGDLNEWREEHYFDNGDIEEFWLTENAVAKYNKDTSEITGIVSRNGNEVNLFCKNKKCFFTYKNQFVSSFDYKKFSDFDNERLRVTYGVYDRKIKGIKMTTK